MKQSRQVAYSCTPATQRRNYKPTSSNHAFSTFSAANPYPFHHSLANLHLWAAQNHEILLAIYSDLLDTTISYMLLPSMGLSEVSCSSASSATCFSFFSESSNSPSRCNKDRLSCWSCRTCALPFSMDHSWAVSTNYLFHKGRIRMKHSCKSGPCSGWIWMVQRKGNQDCLRQRLLMLYQVSAIYRW